MKRLYLYLITGLSLLLGAASAYFINTGNGISAGLAGLGAFLFIEYIQEKSVELTNQKHVKAVNNTATTVLEVVLVGGLLSSQDLPIMLSVAVLSSMLALKSLKDNCEAYMKSTIDVRFDQRGRVLVTLATMALSTFNTYYIFIGAWVLLGSVFVDMFEVFYSSRDIKESSKLKNRILSS